MNIKPILKRQPDFPREYLGYAQTAFFGGRNSVPYSQSGLPGRVHGFFFDVFHRQYPDGHSGDSSLPREIRVVEHCKDRVEEYLRKLTPDMLFEPETWTGMNGFVKVVPNGDVLPIRSKYSPASNDWQVGINHVLRQERRCALVFNPRCCRLYPCDRSCARNCWTHF